jgi:two-component system LytT family response regulator
LSALPWVQCVGEADDVPAAREAIATLAPDLVLLDVQMPSGSGFDVLDGLETVPAVVFVTAYDTYAVRAFQANALDYLVKPVEAPRLLEALQRARQREVVAGETPSRAAGRARPGVRARG